MAAEPDTQTSREHTLGMLETEKLNPATLEIDRMSPLEIAQVMNAEDAKVAQAVKHELPQIARAIEETAQRLRRGGRLIYMGAGTSGRLGVLDASECPPTFNLPIDVVIGHVAGGPMALTHAHEDAEDSAKAGHAAVAQFNITASDVIVGLSASGRTPYVLGAIAHARDKGALTIGIACNTGIPLEKEVDIMIAPVVGPEVITGSTRLKAGTAQKMVLNMLSTGSMILMGKTFGNLMVDVQPTNYKLHQRALKIVQVATGLDKEQAETLLQASGGEVKTAIVVGHTGIEPELARKHLSMHDNVLRKTLDALQ